MLSFQHTGIEVTGSTELVPVTVEFHRDPPYDCYGLPAQDYPRVFAERGASSPHRMPEDGRLCLWSPFDPPELRWCAEDGLQSLLDITARHLFAETYWRHTGGHATGVWPIPEAPHGVPTGRSRPRRRARLAAAPDDCSAWRGRHRGGGQ